ncbi:uncharacterized protein LOC115629264 [Scaptodrosophila lebanonensis]|uniref:Uncharacterized protein LOC115629264 n=1 Tax=Drosophila lebanonensis TaxID=7225 RepID=A0A6J2U245_DROLE|nr:uncharacterized protein LOC115629264 [Scaptodrosophila lebanonensis]
MDQFSHDLTLALEETSLMDRACGVGRWGSRRRTRSTGNLPCAPQPTEDSSSSPTDNLTAHGHVLPHATANIDGLDNVKMPASDSDEKAEGMLPLRLPYSTLNAAVRMSALESDSLNETNFSPARFYKPSSRRKRKIKRMSMEFEFNKDSNFVVPPHGFIDSPLQPGMLGAGISTTGTGIISVTGTVRKRVLKPESGNRSNLFFCGKRKRSNRDRYHDHEHTTSTKLHSSSMPRYSYMDEHHRMRPRSYSSTSKPHSERLLPLNKGLLSKINRIAQQQKTDQSPSNVKELPNPNAINTDEGNEGVDDIAAPSSVGVNVSVVSALSSETIVPVSQSEIDALLNMPAKIQQQQQLPVEADYHAHRKKGHGSASKANRRRRFCQSQYSSVGLQSLHSQSMDCSELYDFLSSSSLSSSSESEDSHQRHDTDREGDDELTDWPGNEFGPGGKYDPKRKLTKKSLLPQIRSDDTIGEDDTLMSGTETSMASAAAALSSPVSVDVGASQSPVCEPHSDMSRFHPAISEPIEICGGANRNKLSMDYISSVSDLVDLKVCFDMKNDIDSIPPLKQLESEMSGETSNPFLSSSPGQASEVREIRAGCRRINGDRPGFSIKLSVNERLARFLQDPRQTQIRLPDIEIYQRDSLFNLATLYSLTMVVEHGCTVLTKTRNTTQSVNIDQHRGLQRRQDLFSDFKRRCYGDTEGTSLLQPK